ncbi:MAG: hypothetical protein F6K47_32150 [Symploca sp. SIO2E6]|nr:hypothetical protein [Symploca sp. SIO2E6]
MDTLKRLKDFKSTYTGINWRDMKFPPSIKPNDSLSFCDLRSARFDKLDLSNVEFFGCLLNGASFREAILHETKFLYCFSSPDYAPTDFITGILRNVKVQNSHLISCLFDAESKPIFANLSWPSEVLAAATKMLSERNDLRYDAVEELGNLGNPVASPILGCMLADPEWDVRASSFEALQKLSPWDFIDKDLILLKWMLLSLGDKHSIVRHKASELIETLSQNNINLLFRSIDEMSQSPLLEQQLTAVGIAIELNEIDEQYLSLLERDDLKRILLIP